MSNGYSRDDVEAILASLESDDSEDVDEAVPAPRMPFRRPAPRTAPGTASYRAPMPNSYVTQKDLQENIQRVDAKLTTNAEAIKTVNARLNTLTGDIARQTAAIKKETDDRKKDAAALRNNVQLSTLLPLLTQPKTKDVTDAVPNTTLTKGDKILVDGSSSLTSLLPILLLGGLGAPSDGTSASSAGGMSDPTTMLVLLLALTQR